MIEQIEQIEKLIGPDDIENGAAKEQDLIGDCNVHISANLGWVYFRKINITGHLIAETGTGIKASTGIKAGSIEVGWGIEARWGIKATTGSIEAGTSIKASTGSIEASTGSIEAGTSIEATTGSIEAGWDIEASTGSIKAGTSIEATTGSIKAGTRIEASTGSIKASTSIEAGWGIEASTGSIEASTGSIEAGMGSIEARWDIEAGEGIKAGLMISCRTLTARFGIFAGICIWKTPETINKQITCESIDGMVLYGDVQLSTGHTELTATGTSQQHGESKKV